MKRLLLLSSCLLFVAAVFAQFEITAGYSMSVPGGKMKDYINLTHSISLRGIYRIPVNTKIWVGTDLSIGTYAEKTEKQTYEFTDGSTTTNVRFSSNVFNGHAVIGYDLLKEGKIVPYITAKAGFSNYYSNIYIENPHDPNGCHALQNKNVFGDATFSYGAGAGVRFDGRKIFNSKSDNWAIEFSVNYLTGGTLDYLNVRHIQDNAGTGKDFMVKFVNVTTQQIHEHKVSEVYTSKLHQSDIRLSFVYRL